MSDVGMNVGFAEVEIRVSVAVAEGEDLWKGEEARRVGMDEVYGGPPKRREKMESGL